MREDKGRKYNECKVIGKDSMALGQMEKKNCERKEMGRKGKGFQGCRKRLGNFSRLDERREREEEIIKKKGRKTAWLEEKRRKRRRFIRK